jgi:hypothetical protein
VAPGLSLSSGNVAADHPTGGYALRLGKTMNPARLTDIRRSGAPPKKGLIGVSRSSAGFRVDFPPQLSSIGFFRAQRALEMPKGGESS